VPERLGEPSLSIEYIHRNIETEKTLAGFIGMLISVE
jgi:hypothetical protein